MTPRPSTTRCFFFQNACVLCEILCYLLCCVVDQHDKNKLFFFFRERARARERDRERERERERERGSLTERILKMMCLQDHVVVIAGWGVDNSTQKPYW